MSLLGIYIIGAIIYVAVRSHPQDNTLEDYVALGGESIFWPLTAIIFLSFVPIIIIGWLGNKLRYIYERTWNYE